MAAEKPGTWQTGPMTGVQKDCRRCGTCCMKGGPALHTEDLALIGSGRLPLNRLISIRKGELVDDPLTGTTHAARYELVKICGTGREWRCFYYSPEEGCSFYASRPLACRVLRCWEPDEILALVGKDMVSRLDILPLDHPLRPLVAEHEGLCPCPDMERLRDAVTSGSLKDLGPLQTLVDADMAFRDRVVRKHSLTLALELFVFGRPLFQLLQAVGIHSVETAGRIRLSQAKKTP